VHYPRVHRPVSFLHKCLGTVLFLILALIGIAGLILPIIPGLVFLLLAVYVLTRVSRRVASYAHQQDWYTGSMGRVQSLSPLSLAERAKLCALLAARSLLHAAQWLEKRITGSPRD
jgi:uncharacterized membrane protein YbaN (DUF454 family)